MTEDLNRFRRFGVYHRENLVVGEVNPPDGIAIWGLYDIREDGTLEYRRFVCGEMTETVDFTWEDVGGGAIRVVPQETAPDGTFIWGADSVAGVIFSTGDGCDDIVEFVDYTEESGKSDLTLGYVPGALCGEPTGEGCGFTFVWCDGVAPMVCE